MADRTRTAGQAMTEVHYDFEELNAIVVEADDNVIEQMKINDPELTFDEDPVRFPTIGEDSVNHNAISSAAARKLQEMPYGLELVQAPEAWEKGYTGENVKVCVIDSGIDENHPGFEKPFEGIETSIPWGKDGCGHGTHVAGTIAGKDVGVAPSSEIVVVRIFNDDCGIAYSSRIYQAAKECAAKGAKIISMSLGGPIPSWIEYKGFKDLYEDDILSIAAAGNGGNAWWSYPASYTGVLSVAAIDSDEEHAPFSQRNAQVDIAAPGVGVYSTFPENGCIICGGDTEYGAISGTSMATPHVSGVAALAWSAFPDATAEKIMEAMEKSAVDLGKAGFDKKYGHGLVQAMATIQYLDGAGFEAGNNGVGGVGTDNTGDFDICQDEPGWHDEDGDEFDCAFYAEGSNCEDYGSQYPYNGMTANDACCTCGGGVDLGAPADECTDVAGWHDAESASFDCVWYADKENCLYYGDLYEYNGMTANQACCVCKSL
mmetsp:Transcript_15843/g.24667  ORF Transcript_15843/g.24667 Transcript_15843/m.24667 type:complete len:487 (+) Transcript_15843:395-1855(+)